MRIPQEIRFGKGLTNIQRTLGNFYELRLNAVETVEPDFILSILGAFRILLAAAQLIVLVGVTTRAGAKLSPVDGINVISGC